MEQQNQVAKRVVITQTLATNDNLVVVYNGMPCNTKEERTEALRQHYRLKVLKMYGIATRDEDGNLLRNEMVINGQLIQPKLPKPLRDEEDGGIIENLAEYYERTRVQASGAYRSVAKGLERIDFVTEMK